MLLLLVAGLTVAFGTKPKSKTKSKPSKQSRTEQVKKEQAKIARDWYNSLQESLTGIATEVVKGRTIVLDPGHTDCSPGAEGPKHRITEADLNWQVATRLETLLAAAGARVVLTKHYGLPKPVDQRNMEADLDSRAAVSNRERADLFISVHHNWTSDPAVNRTEVYYRLDDAGASHDAANYVMIHLSRNLGLDGEVLPANFRVLRVNTRPALLTEASYMSNPLQESLLAMGAKQELEAQAIYLGVLDYFSHGVPEFMLLTDLAGVTQQNLPQFRIRLSGSVEPDRATIRAWLDGGPTKIEYAPTEKVCVITPTQRLTNGPHRLHFEARNARGNAGIPLDTTFLTDREPARIALAAFPPVCPPDHTVMEIRANVYDRDGQPVADTRRVSFTADRDPLGDSALRGGLARVYLSQSKPAQMKITARCGAASASLTAVFAAAKTPLAQFRILRTDDRQPVPGALVVDDWRADTSWANADGIVTLLPRRGDHRFTFTAPGFRPAGLDLKFDSLTVLSRDVKLEPQFAGTLIGIRIALDPAGNWEQPDTSREAFAFNLALARRLASLLERCGATVEIAATESHPVTKTDRLFHAGSFKPDYYVRLSTQTGSPARAAVTHYEGSAAGTPAAEAIGSSLRALSQLTGVEVGSEQSYEIVQAPSPAVGISFRFANPAAADTLLISDLARQVLLGLARRLGSNPPCHLGLHVTDSKGNAVPGARITIDDLLTYAVDTKGELNISQLETGPHRVAVTCPGYTAASADVELAVATPALDKTITLTRK